MFYKSKRGKNELEMSWTKCFFVNEKQSKNYYFCTIQQPIRHTDTMITIGNPIFDSVFKFFLADDTAARILLSALIKQKVSVEKKGFKMQFDDTLAEGDSDMQKIVNRLSMVFTDDHTTELMMNITVDKVEELISVN